MNRFYNTLTLPVVDFPDRQQLTQRILQTVRGLQVGRTIAHTDIAFSLPVDHIGNYFTAEQVLLRLRRLVGASVQQHIADPRYFLHEVKDSDTIGLTTLYSRYVRSLLANCLHRLDPSNDFVSIIQCDSYNCLYFANSADNASSSLKITALLCPHVEPDWRLDDFCRREVQLYNHDLYGDRGHFSQSEFITEEGLDELDDEELREYAYRRGVFATPNSYRKLTREGTYALLYSYDVCNNPRPKLTLEDTLDILQRRISLKNVTEAEAYYWLRFFGVNEAVARFDSRRPTYLLLLMMAFGEYKRREL